MTTTTPPTARQLERAKAMIQAKRYDDARALLVTIDHPTADRWLARLSAMPSAAAPTPSFTGKLVLSIALLFVLYVPGVIATFVFAGEARSAQRHSPRPIPGARGLHLLQGFVIVFPIVSLITLIVLMLLVNFL